MGRYTFPLGIVAGLLFGLVTPLLSQAQQGDALLSRDAAGTKPIEPTSTPGNFGQGKPASFPSKDTNKVDPTEIETFVKEVAGAEKGPVIESERERIIKEFEVRYNVFLHDRDLLITSDVDAKGLVSALNNSINNSNYSPRDNQLRFTVKQGTKTLKNQSFEDLEPYNKQAYLNSLRFGNVPKGVRLPGLASGSEAYSGGATNLYAPSGSQKTVGLSENYTSQVTQSPYGGGNGQPPAQYPTSYDQVRSNLANRDLVNKSGLPSELFRKLSVDPQLPAGGATILRSLDDRAKEYYSNGRPRFDQQGNEIYPNGNRKFSSNGIPLYSNGRPKMDGNGVALHSNGRPMKNDNGQALYPDGKPRTTKTGVELFQNGRKKWGGDGQDPTKVDKLYGRTEPGTSVELGAEPQLRRRPVSANQALSGKAVGSSSVDELRAVEKQGTPLYRGGVPAMTATGVKLHPNATQRFAGDGLGNIDEPAIPQASQAEAVDPLFPNGRPAVSEQGDPLFSNGNRRVDSQGNSLYPNGRPMANADARALTPSGDAVQATAGFQGRTQGSFEMYHLYEGQIVEIVDKQLVLKPTGKTDTITFELEQTVVCRDDGKVLLPGTVEQLTARLKVKVVGLVEETFIDGRMVSSAEVIRAVAVSASNPRVGQDIKDGVYPVIYLASGITRQLGSDQLLLSTGPTNQFAVSIDEETQLQRVIRGETVPANVQATGLNRKVDVIVRQDVRIENGMLKSTDPQHALAVLQN